VTGSIGYDGGAFVGVITGRLGVTKETGVFAGVIACRLGVSNETGGVNVILIGSGVGENIDS
jgi:hypothetical protein